MSKPYERIAYVSNPSEFDIKDAIVNTPQSYFFVHNPSEEMSTLTTELNPILFKYIEHQTTETVLQALSCSISLHRYVKLFNKETVKALVAAGHFEYLQRLNDYDAEYLKELVAMNPSCIEYATLHFEDAIKLALTMWPEYILQCEQTEDRCNIVIDGNPLFLKLIHKPSQTEALILRAVTKNGDALQHAHIQTEQIVMAAIKNKANSLQHVWNKTDSIILEAVKRNANAIRYGHYNSDEINMEAVSQDGNLLSKIEKPSKEVIMRAIQTSSNSILHVQNPTEEMCIEHVKFGGVNALSAISNKTERVCRAVLDVNPYDLHGYLARTRFSDDFYFDLVKKAGMMLPELQAIPFPPDVIDQLEIVAVQQDWNALRFVRNKNEKLCLIAYEQDCRALFIMQAPALEEPEKPSQDSSQVSEMMALKLQRELEWKLHLSRAEKITTTSRRTMDIV